MANYKKPYEEDCCAADHENHKKRDFPVVIFNCGNGSGVTLPVTGAVACAGNQAVIGSWGAPTLIIGTVNLDTRGLDHPSIKIDFSSLVNFRADSDFSGYSLRIIFQLSRSCEHENKVPLATWVYQNEISVNLGIPVPDLNLVDIDVESKEPFNFVWCDCHDCPGCCVYLVEIIDISAYNIESASITNVGISSIASGFPDRD